MHPEQSTYTTALHHCELTEQTKSGPHRISIDSSNDPGREKMNPMTVRTFDVNRLKNKFLLCAPPQVKEQEQLRYFLAKWIQFFHDTMCHTVCLSVDDTSVYSGARNSLCSRIHEKNIFQAYILGCPCHILHNTSSKTAAILAKATSFDVEDLAVDISYWLDKSTKRKIGLEEFSVFCATACKAIVSRVSTCWLSLEQAINRILELFVSLACYFKSNSKPQA